jgi:hypothetical protein
MGKPRTVEDYHIHILPDGGALVTADGLLNSSEVAEMRRIALAIMLTLSACAAQQPCTMERWLVEPTCR